MQTLSKSAHMHTTGYFNMEALQATKVLAHYENTVEKHALPNANTTTRRRAQEEVVQNRHRENTQAWGKIPENYTFLSLPQKVYILYPLPIQKGRRITKRQGSCAMLRASRGALDKWKRQSQTQ